MRPSWLLLPFAKDAKKNHLSPRAVIYSYGVPRPGRAISRWKWAGTGREFMPVTHFHFRFFLPSVPPFLFLLLQTHGDVNQSPCPQLTTAPSPVRAMLPGVSVPRFRPERRVRISIKSIGSYPPPTTDGCWITARLSRTTFFDIYRSEKQNWHLLRSLPCFQVRPQAASTSYVIFCFEMAWNKKYVERSQLGSGMLRTEKQKLAIPT